MCYCKFECVYIIFNMCIFNVYVFVSVIFFIPSTGGNGVAIAEGALALIGCFCASTSAEIY